MAKDKRPLLALLGAVLIVSLMPVAVARGGVLTTAAMLCGHDERKLVHNSHGEALFVRNPYWHGRGETCIRNRSRMANFRVRRVAGLDGSGKVNGYPDIIRGCIWRSCTPHTNMPVRVRRIRSLHMTWHTRQGVRGAWNAATDLWFGKHKTGPHGATRDGAELMIWINSRDVGRHTDRSPIVRIDGLRWHFWPWRTCDWRIGTCWNYISYRLVHPRWRVDHLNLKAFIRHSERHRLIRARWWLQSVGAGFEIWRGGRGLATTAFGVLLRRS